VRSLDPQALFVAFLVTACVLTIGAFLWVAQRMGELRYKGELLDAIIDKLGARLKSLETWRAAQITKRLKRIGWSDDGLKTQVRKDAPSNKSGHRRKPT